MRISGFLLAVMIGLGMLPAAVHAAKPAHTGAAAGQHSAKHYDESQLKILEARLAKRPQDAALKREVAEANYQVGHAMMTNTSLPPRMRYRGALKYFRRAMVLNRSHHQAAAERKMIEDVYRGMGMPVPE